LTSKSSKLTPASSAGQNAANNAIKASAIPRTQQFGVSLSFIKENNNGDVIAPTLKQCVEFLSQPEGMYEIRNQ